MKHFLAATFSSLVVFSAVHFNAAAQSDQGWRVILDGSRFGEWSRLGESNWRIDDGAVVADKRSGAAASFLVSKDKYTCIPQVAWRLR